MWSGIMIVFNSGWERHGLLTDGQDWGRGVLEGPCFISYF